MPQHNYADIRKSREPTGRFYTSISLRTADRRSIVKYLRDANRVAWVSPEKSGFVCVFDELSDQRNIRDLNKLAVSLTMYLHCTAVAMVKEGFSLIWYQLYEGGQIIGESRPESDSVDDIGLLPPHEKETETACKTLVIEAHQSEPDGIKTSQQLIDLIDLPLIASSLSFNHIEQDEFELELDDLASDDIIDSPFEDQLEALRHNSLKKLGWTKTVGSKRKQDGRTAGDFDQVLYSPDFVTGAAPINADDIDGFLYAAMEKLAKRDFKGAIEDFDQVIKLSSEFPHAYYGRHNRAVAKSQIGDTKGAIDDLLAAVKLTNDCDETKVLLTKLLSSA